MFRLFVDIEMKKLTVRAFRRFVLYTLNEDDDGSSGSSSSEGVDDDGNDNDDMVYL